VAPLLALSPLTDPLWWTNLLVLVGIYAILGLSLNLINGYGGMFSLGHHGFWAMGAFGAGWLTRVLEAQHVLPGPMIFVLSALLAMGVAAVGGLVIGIPCLRLRGDYLAIATLGFGEIVRIVVQNSDPDVLGGSLGLRVPRVLMEVSYRTKLLFQGVMAGLTLLVTFLVAIGIRNYIRSSRGRAMLAVAQDETAAGLLGINPTRPKVMAFVVGAAIAGLAGALYAHYMGIINPLDFNFMVMVKIFLVIVLGGLGSISGCILAAFFLIGFEEYLYTLPQSLGWVKDWWQVWYALILVLLMIFRPHGLLGRNELGQVIRGAWIRWRYPKGTPAS
jgi:branched-chain amino acid transport system permease protein